MEGRGIESVVNRLFWAVMGDVYAEGVWYIGLGLHYLHRQRS